MMTQLGQQPTASIPQACGQWSDIKAAYRFLDNDSIEPPMLLAGHTDATVGRMQKHAVVLALQDTTRLDYSTHPQTEGLGPTSNNPDKTLGLFVHSTFAVTVTGEPLGLLSVQVHCRDPKEFGRSRDSQKRNRAAIQDKESQRWLNALIVSQQLAPRCPQSTLINVADREADIYELFFQALERSSNPAVHLLIRAQHNRQVAGAHRKLWAHLAAQEVAARIQVRVPRKNGQPGRTARLAIRCTPVTLQAPCLKDEQPSLAVWAIEAREEAGLPSGQSGILWRLLTTLPITCAAEAVEKVGWYAQRWQIEVLHKVLKSGCKIEQRQLQTALRIQRVLMMDLIIAWRIMLLTRTSRETPLAPASQWMLEAEWKVLWCYMNPARKPPQQAPGMRECVRWIGRLGGFIGRKSDGEPGPIVLWRGLQRLHDMVLMWERLQNCG